MISKFSITFMILRLKFFYFIFFAICSYNEKVLAEQENEKEKAIHHFMQGEFFLNQGNYALAVLEFQDALDNDPNASTIHTSIADAYRRLGRQERALTHLQIAIDLDPEDLSSREMMGHIYLINRDYSMAEVVFSVLIKKDPSNDEYLTIFADLAKIQKNWDVSINHYLLAYEANPLKISNIENALQVCLNAQLFERAELVCKLLTKSDPSNFSYWQTYKQITAYNKNYDATLLALSKMEKINGVSIKLLLEKSAIKEEKNNIDDAISDLIEAFKMDSSDAEPLKRLISINLENQNFKDADYYNHILLEKFIDDPNGYINAAIIALNDSLPKRAINYLYDKVQKFDDNYSVHYLLGTSYFQIKDLPNSEIYLLKALKIFPGSRACKHTLAMIYDQIGSWFKSDSLYLDLISTDSSDAQAYNNYAYSLVERNDNLEIALEMSVIANKIEPKSAPYLDTLGWIYFKLDQYDKALEYVQESFSLDNKNPVILEHLADILKAMDQISKANLIYMQAIDIGGDSLKIKKKMLFE